MTISMGTILIECGIAGLVLFAVIGVICWVRLRRQGQQLLHAIEREYQ